MYIVTSIGLQNPTDNFDMPMPDDESDIELGLFEKTTIRTSAMEDMR